MKKAKKGKVEKLKKSGKGKKLGSGKNLATKYRPRRLKDMVGQEAAVSKFRGMLAKKNIPNTILLVGPTGCGKTTMARMIARYVNCETMDACGKCESCRFNIDHDHPDFKEENIGADKGIDHVRSLIQQSRFKPRFNMRVILLDEVHNLTGPAAEAMLKPLEHPPEATLWILATTDPQKLKNTVVNRCQALVLNMVNADQVKARLRYICDKEGLKFGDSVLTAIAEASGGYMRQAIQTLENVMHFAAGQEGKLDGKKLDKMLMEEAMSDAGSVESDRIAAAGLNHIYCGRYVGFMNALAKTGQNDFVSLINKMIWYNGYLIDCITVKDKSPHVWHNPQNRMFKDLVVKETKKLATGELLPQLMQLQAALCRLRGEMQSFVLPQRPHIYTALRESAMLFRKKDK